MARRPTISDVARAAGVSVGTASNVVNCKGRHSETTRARVMQAAECLHFAPNALIRSLQTGTTNTVGVFIWRVFVGAWHEMTLGLLQGISRGLAEASRDVLLYSRHPHEGELQPVYFLDGRVDAVILAPGGLPRDGLQHLTASGLPTVTMYQSDVPDGVGSVRIDNCGGVAAVVDHLVELGHRKIAFVSPAYSDDFRERREAFRVARDRHGLDPREEWLRCDSDVGESDVAGIVARLATSGDRPTAIVAGNDGYAITALGVIEGLGLEVPREVSVTGFDDIGAARASNLTTVRQPADEVGFSAARMTLQMLNGTNGERPNAVLPVQLVTRGTTAPPAQV